MIEQTDRIRSRAPQWKWEEKRTCACCARHEQRRTQHIATKDAEEKHEEETQNMGFAQTGVGIETESMSVNKG